MNESNSDDVVWYTVDVSWRDVHMDGDPIQIADEFRVTAEEAAALSLALRDTAARVIVFPRRKRAGEDDGGFFTVGKQSLITCEARRETEERWAARQALSAQSKNPNPPSAPQKWIYVGNSRFPIVDK